MRILITGGAGFIGSHLCEAMLNNGHYVICVDNYITSTQENIAHLLGNKNFELVEQDVIEGWSTLSLVPSYSALGCIFHLASPASPVDYSDLPIETLMVNSLGTRNVLELGREHSCRVILASTSEAYGDPQVSPQLETYWGNVNPVGARSCYDEAKRFAEALGMAYYRTHQMDVVIMRIFNTFGPRMRRNDGRVVPNFINQALANEPLTIYGDGNQTRSFCYVDDLIDGLIKVMECKSENISGEVINLGNPNAMTVMDLAEHIKEITGSTSKIAFLPLPPDDPTRRKPDISKAKSILGWRPKIGLNQGLKRVVEWFQNTNCDK